MSMTINNNMMAENVNRNLTSHYGKLGKSTQRLSSGLRVSSAADDAAGLAIRELMRADISALNQGARNANDGISMIQTADGSLGVIDAKLIRMKELAEQASTGTYTDAQRKMINQEYQLMADEITRIASDTDFNSKKLLAGTGQDVEVEKSVASSTGSEEAVMSKSVGHEETWSNKALRKEEINTLSNVTKVGPVDKDGIQKINNDATAGSYNYVSRSGKATIEIVTNTTAEDGTIDLKNGAVTDGGFATAELQASVYSGDKVTIEQKVGTVWKDVTSTIAGGGTDLSGEVRISVEGADGEVYRDTFSNSATDFTVTMTAAGKNYSIQSKATSNTSIQVKSEVAASKTFDHTVESGMTVKTDAVSYFKDNSATFAGAFAELGHNAKSGELTGNKSVESELKNSYGTEQNVVKEHKIEIFNDATNTWDELALGNEAGTSKVDIMDGTSKFRITADYGDGKKVRDTVSNNTGGRFTVTKTQYGLSIDMKAGADAQKSTTQLKVQSEDMVVVDVHFGSSSSKTDGYDTEINMATAKSLGVGQEAGDNILTQDNAKKALENITLAISKKDKIRAQLGATQNRLSATVENISIQKENLKAAESRISDVNVATEMTEFNRQQILANAAVSMLAQANNLPKMAQKLLG